MSGFAVGLCGEQQQEHSVLRAGCRWLLYAVTSFSNVAKAEEHSVCYNRGKLGNRSSHSVVNSRDDRAVDVHLGGVARLLSSRQPSKLRRIV